MPRVTSATVEGKRGHAPQGGKGRGKGELLIPRFAVPKLPRETRIHYTPWLLIRSAAGDYGGRPLASGSVFWELPDVWVTSSLGVNQPVPGEENTVSARVTNLGAEQANGVVVRFWWADPSLAITEVSAHLIGIAFADIPARRTQVVNCPTAWIPIEENGGHECLLVEAWVPEFDPLTAPMDPVVDRHVGQKNEQLIGVAAGESFSLRLAAANVAPFAQAVAFEIQPIRSTVTELSDAGAERTLGALSSTAAQLPLMLAIEERPNGYVPSSLFFARRLLSMSTAAAMRDGDQCQPMAWISQSRHLDAWESRSLEISGAVPRNAVIGQTFRFRVAQRSGPIITGGYTFGVVVRPR